MPKNILGEILEHKKGEIAERKRICPLESFKDQVKPGNGKFLTAVSNPGFNIIAEIKPKSPSAGILRQEIDIASVIDIYDRYAVAISVLADEKYFGGSIDLLQRIASVSSRPVLCKEFVIDAYQCIEARAAGAQAILLIVKALSDRELLDLHEAAVQVQLTPVVEIQNEEELERAFQCKPAVIMINNRDLRTLELDLSTTKRLAPKIPAGITVISASGIQSKADIEQLGSYCKNFLIGSSIMQAKDIEKALSELVGSRIKA